MDPILFFILILLIVGVIFVIRLRTAPSQYTFSQNQSALQPKNKKIHLECPLIEKKTISYDTYLFTFALPKQNQVLGIRVGEHIILHENIKTREHPEGELVERKYTPTSTIGQKGKFDLLIKIYRPQQHPRFPDGGKLTSWIEFLKPNEPIHITGPYGNLNYQGNGLFRMKDGDQVKTQRFNRIVMIAGGSGITPMYQIIQAVINNGGDQTRLALLFANKTEEDILLYEELKAYSKLKRLSLSFTLDNTPPNWEGFKGFVTVDMVRDAFQELDTKTIALSCGPGPMNSLAIEHFQALGASPKNIFVF